MKVKIRDEKNSQKIIEIEIGADAVKAAVEDAYNTIGKDVQIPGFRKGKAPKDILKNQFDKEAGEEAVRKLVWKSYREVAADKGIEALGYPVIENINFKEDRPLTFTVRVDVRPSFSLKDYTGIKVRQKAVELKDEEVAQSLNSLAESAADFKDVLIRNVQINDYIMCDYECSVAGKIIDKKENAWFHVADNSPLKGLSGAVVGAKKEDVRYLRLELPEDYSVKGYANQTAEYKITIKSIKEKSFPKIDDEFAKRFGDCKGVDELKDRIKDNILEKKRLDQRHDMENQIFDELLKNNIFDVPASLVEKQLEHLVNDAKTRLGYAGYKKEDIEKEEEKLKENLRPVAERQVKIYFILDEVAKNENIKAGKDEIDDYIMGLVQFYKQDYGKLKDQFQQNGTMEEIKHKLEHDRACDFLIENAKKIK